MHFIPFIISLGLVASTAAQPPTSTIESVPDYYDPDQFETTVTLAGPSGTGTVWDCFIEKEDESDQEVVEIECTSLSQVALPTSTISSRTSALQQFPMKVLEKRMQRKFGVKARQDDLNANNIVMPTATNQPSSCNACSTVTVTSIAYTGNNSDICSPIPTAPINKGVLPPYPVPVAQLSAMSIVADMLSNEVSAEAPRQSAANIIPAILSALTANKTNPTAAGNLNRGNSTVVAPTLGAPASSAILSPPPSQARSIGTSTAVGILANLIAAAGIAWLLV